MRTYASVIRSISSFLPNVTMTLPSIVGATLVYSYFNYVDPTDPAPRTHPLRDLLAFVSVSGSLIVASLYAAGRYFRPVEQWLARLRAGEGAADVPLSIRRRVINAPLFSAVLSLAGWTLAGSFYFPYQIYASGFTAAEAWRVFSGIVLVGGPVATSLSFLISEYFWRRNIPLFFPDGQLEGVGVLRVPILLRMGATFLVTAVLPPLVMLIASFTLGRRFGAAMPDAVHAMWVQLVRTQGFIVAATGIASVLMALLVARFINRPVQALRAAMAQVAAGDLTAHVPVQSTDELGELNDHFNSMVAELRRAERTRELFGRYVSPAVARQALERGIAFGGELVRATAMFVDLRGFTALTQKLEPARVVELLNDYYEVVERVCEREGGVIAQFLGDGVIVVFGGPLKPLRDHARHAIHAAIGVQHELSTRTAGGEPLLVGIGICTGDIIAGNVGSSDRVTYTIVGDAVNQAARLQVKTRELGAPILVTESTRAALGEPNGLVLRSCGALPLKGIAAPVEVYAVAA